MSDDLYADLGVPRSADAKRIKKAFRYLARHHHPDKSQAKESPKIFAAATEAYRILGDPDKRALYDEHGMDFQKQVPSVVMEDDESEELIDVLMGE